MERIARLAEQDLPGVLALNNAHATETSPLTRETLADLINGAAHARGIDGGSSAFLIALDQDAPYESPNYLWFRARHDRFLYIDRVITAPAARGRGLARRLYEDLFSAAAGLGYGIIGCEVNIEPPNPASDAFHASMGFTEVGRAHLSDRAKTVRYLEREINIL